MVDFDYIISLFSVNVPSHVWYQMKEDIITHIVRGMKGIKCISNRDGNHYIGTCGIVHEYRTILIVIERLTHNIQYTSTCAPNQTAIGSTHADGIIKLALKGPGESLLKAILIPGLRRSRLAEN